MNTISNFLFVLYFSAAETTNSILFAPRRRARTTSYNVCYTKLLREAAVLRADMANNLASHAGRCEPLRHERAKAACGSLFLPSLRESHSQTLQSSQVHFIPEFLAYIVLRVLDLTFIPFRILMQFTCKRYCGFRRCIQRRVAEQWAIDGRHNHRDPCRHSFKDASAKTLDEGGAREIDEYVNSSQECLRRQGSYNFV